MIFRQHHEDLLDEHVGMALGKLLMAFQALERAVKGAFDLACAPSDALGIVGLIIGDQTSNRRIENTKRIVKHVAKLYGVHRVKFAARYPLTFGMRSPEDTNQSIADAFSAFTYWLDGASRVLQYRNRLLHGEVRAEEGMLKFTAKGMFMPISADEIEKRRQEALATGFGLSLSANGFSAAVTYLMRSPPTSKTPAGK